MHKILLGLLVLLAPPCQTTPLIMYKAEPFTALGVHLGIWHDVERCLGKRANPNAIQWGVAERIVDPRGWLPYGAAIFDGDGKPLAIVLDREYAFHASVVSHEAIHVITGDSAEDTPEMRRCQMAVPGNLAWRRVPQDTVLRYAGLLVDSLPIR